MTLQSSGAIDLGDIAAEFGGAAPHALSEYYAAASGVPSSGAIDFADFYGKSNVIESTHTLTIGSTGKGGLTRGFDAGSYGSISPTGHNGRTIEALNVTGSGSANIRIELTGSHAQTVFLSMRIDGYTFTAASATYTNYGSRTQWSWNWAGPQFPSTGSKTVYMTT